MPALPEIVSGAEKLAALRASFGRKARPGITGSLGARGGPATGKDSSIEQPSNPAPSPQLAPNHPSMSTHGGAETSAPPLPEATVLTVNWDTVHALQREDSAMRAQITDLSSQHTRLSFRVDAVEDALTNLENQPTSAGTHIGSQHAPTVPIHGSHCRSAVGALRFFAQSVLNLWRHQPQPQDRPQP